MFREMGLFGLRKKKPGFNPSGRYEDNMPEYIPNYNGNLISDAEEYAIVYAIQNRDEFFDRDNFLAYAQKVFISLQKAWSNQELKTIQYYENVDLYEQHLQQLKQYKDKGEKNVVEMILVRNVEFLSLKEDQGKDVLSVVLTCSMIDYIKNEKTGKIVFGDDKSRINRMYQMTFVRDKSAKTSQKGVAEKEVECPNCGAHSMIKYSKECKYCGTFLKIAENDWMLSNLEPFVIEKRKNK